jgi:UDP-N-acetyl-2-amino-2-deoxyglucuronate dehydrogenase
MQKKTYALCGAAGYIAPRHMKAIRETGGELMAALDPNDSVGIIDSYFPEAAFFTEFERFDRHVDKLRRAGTPLDILSVCSPNYLHDAHIRFGLRNHMDVICEKPLVLNPWNIDGLLDMERETSRRVYTVLQLRLHPAIIALKKEVENNPERIFDIDLTYVTPRGVWYYASWKGDMSKSGGVATNIGIHFFDVLMWIFGDIQHQEIHLHTHDRAAGYFEFSRAKVRWFLSIDADTLPKKGKTSFRSMKINQEEFDFSQGFTDLHTLSYAEVLAGRGFSLEESRKSIELVHQIRQSPPQNPQAGFHPFIKLPLKNHPFL